MSVRPAHPRGRPERLIRGQCDGRWIAPPRSTINSPGDREHACPQPVVDAVLDPARDSFRRRDSRISPRVPRGQHCSSPCNAPPRSFSRTTCRRIPSTPPPASGISSCCCTSRSRRSSAAGARSTSSRRTPTTRSSGGWTVPTVRTPAARSAVTRRTPSRATAAPALRRPASERRNVVDREPPARRDRDRRERRLHADSVGRPPSEGNWMPIAPEASALIIRQFFYDWDHEVPAVMRIERLTPSSARAASRSDTAPDATTARQLLRRARSSRRTSTSSSPSPTPHAEQLQSAVRWHRNGRRRRKPSSDRVMEAGIGRAR